MKFLRRKKWLLAGTFVVLVVLGVWWGPFLPAFFQVWGARREASIKRDFDPACSENMQLFSAALYNYVSAEGVFPPAEKWMAELKRYMHAADIKRTDELKKFRCPDLPDPGAYGYAYNSQLAGKAPDELGGLEKVPAIYDSEKMERNAHDAKPLDSLPRTPRAGGNNVVYADAATVSGRKPVRLAR